VDCSSRCGLPWHEWIDHPVDSQLPP
jgi:hypothetical protein